MSLQNSDTPLPSPLPPPPPCFCVSFCLAGIRGCIGLVWFLAPAICIWFGFFYCRLEEESYTRHTSQLLPTWTISTRQIVNKLFVYCVYSFVLFLKSPKDTKFYGSAFLFSSQPSCLTAKPPVSQAGFESCISAKTW